MRPIRHLRAAVVALLVAACGGGGDGVTTPNPNVASVVITAPAAAPTFGALGRTVQFAAEARDAAGAAVSGVALTWTSTNGAVATVSASGLVTAVANGSTTVTASGGGRTSTGVTVTVSQVGVSAQISPANSTIGALGSMRQMSAQLLDSTGNPLPSAAPVVWSVSSGGTISTSMTGLVTALAVSPPGQADSVIVQAGPSALTTGTAVIVTQVPAGIVVAVPAGDSVLRTTGRTRQLTATVRDSNASDLVTQPAINWTSNAPGVATVGAATGLVTAVGDGSATIQAAAGGITGARTQLVQRYAQTFTLSPTSASITTDGGTQVFNGVAQDTSGADLAISWQSRATGVATVSPAAGAATTATAVANGSTFIVMSGGMRVDSADLTVSGQSGVTALTVNVGDNFFRSLRNNSEDPAVDTLAAGGTVTWMWIGSNPHSVRSTGSPSFTSSIIQSAGNYQFTFTTPGTYAYDCAVHGAAMTGTVVVQ